MQGSSDSEVKYVSFNQDSSALCVGCNSGFRLFSLNNIDKLDETYYEGTLTNVVIVERLYLSSLVVTVSQNTPRRLSLCHFKKGAEICNYSYPNRVLTVKLNRKRLVVCLTDSLYIHNIRDMKVVHTIKETPENARGVCSLCPSDDCGYLAYPGSSTMGEVQVFDAHHLVPVVTIPAHDNPLVAMNFNRTGDKLATASDKGTVIRTFSMPEGNKLFEFRRGMKRCVTIHSLSFSSDSQLLACTSNTETIHVFKLENTARKPSGVVGPSSNGISSAPSFDDSGNSKTWMGYFGQAIMDSASYLPSNMGDMFTQGRAAYQARIPAMEEDSSNLNICALTWINKILRLAVASTSGHLYFYNLDLTDSAGDCCLIKQHKIDGSTGLGVGGSSKGSSISSERKSSTGSSVKPIDAPPSRSSRCDSGSNITQPENIVTNEDASPRSNAITIPTRTRTFSGPSEENEFDQGGCSPQSYPSHAIGSLDARMRSANSPPATITAPGISYAGALGTSPNDDATQINQHFQTAIRLDDDNEFPPMTMHTDD